MKLNLHLIRNKLPNSHFKNLRCFNIEIYSPRKKKIPAGMVVRKKKIGFGCANKQIRISMNIKVCGFLKQSVAQAAEQVVEQAARRFQCAVDLNETQTYSSFHTCSSAQHSILTPLNSSGWARFRSAVLFNRSAICK